MIESTIVNLSIIIYCRRIRYIYKKTQNIVWTVTCKFVASWQPLLIVETRPASAATDISAQEAEILIVFICFSKNKTTNS